MAKKPYELKIDDVVYQGAGGAHIDNRDPLNPVYYIEARGHLSRATTAPETKRKLLIGLTKEEYNELIKN